MDASIAFKIIENLSQTLNEQFIILCILLFSQIIFIISIIVFIKTQVKTVEYFGTEFVFDSQLDKKKSYRDRLCGKGFWSGVVVSHTTARIFELEGTTQWSWILENLDKTDTDSKG